MVIGESINTYWNRASQPDETLVLSSGSGGDVLIAQVINTEVDEDSLFYSIWANIPRNSGTWYWECYVDGTPDDIIRKIMVGIGVAPNDNTSNVPDITGTYTSNGIKINNTVFRSDGLWEAGGLSGTDFSEDENRIVVGVLLNFGSSSAELTIYINGSLEAIRQIPSIEYYPYLSVQHGTVEANFGDSAFVYSVPEGARPYNCPASQINPNVIWNRASQPNTQMEILPDVNGDLLIAQVKNNTATDEATFYSIWTNISKVTGKWYWEYYVDVANDDPSRNIYLAAGIARNDGSPIVPDIFGEFSSNGIKETKTVYRTNGQVLKNGPIGLINTSQLLEMFTLSFYLDLDNHTFDIRVNNIPIINNDVVNDSLATTAYFPYVAIQRGKVEANFGTKSLIYGTPPGFNRFRSPPLDYSFIVSGGQVNTGLQAQLNIANTVIPVYSNITSKSINNYKVVVQHENNSPINNTDDKQDRNVIIPPIRSSGRISG